ncbi:hypothetical protein U1Q18_015989 [Sarracenia purpurea var. burkii]
MARKVRTTFIAVLALIVFLAFVYHHLFRDEIVISAENHLASPVAFYPQTNPNYAIREEEEEEEEEDGAGAGAGAGAGGTHHSTVFVTSLAHSISTVSILLPAWEVLVIVSPETPLPSDSAIDHYTCLFPNDDVSPAKPSRNPPSFDRAIFKCDFPPRLRHRLPFFQPVLTRCPEIPAEKRFPVPELLRWNFVVYDSLSTENDVIIFVKGVNSRQGINRAPNDLKCVFGDDDNINGVKTAVTTSLQEVFRCRPPEIKAVSSSISEDEGAARIKVSLEISDHKQQVVPSVAYYTPAPKIVHPEPKSVLCACTMVYNVAKFLKEWVMYHSGIGVQKFILYDNDSDDDLERVVEELVELGFNVSTLFWLWPKAQEAGFSHCAVYAKDSCAWMMFLDVDEFVYSPSWLTLSNPSDQMLESLLLKLMPSTAAAAASSRLQSDRNRIVKIGQVMISCYEFGPSNQKSHPIKGVTQGYDCRKRAYNRHKSIVLLDAIDESLLNVIHHFHLKKGYRTKKLSIHDAVVNHYKFQAWSEFKTKFRRRVSAYVVDWTQSVNPESQDRAPGLGYAPVEPKGWEEKFCEVYDNRLKELTRRWLGILTPSGYHMAWQR